MPTAGAGAGRFCRRARRRHRMNIYLLQTVNGIGIGMLYFLLAVGMSIVFGLLRFVNFAHGAFYLLGAYAAFQITRWGLSFWLALLVAPLLVGGMGSFGGALVGGLLIGILQSIMSTLWPAGAHLMIYVAMVAVLLLLPHGLLGRPG
jgi:branched-subunit amino acid ABC-type transport system permease component